MKIIYVLLAVALQGCILPAPEDRTPGEFRMCDRYAHLMDAAKEEWAKDYSLGTYDAGNIDIVFVSAVELPAACYVKKYLQNHPGVTVNGCTVHVDDTWEHPLIVINRDERYESWDGVAVHELMHVMSKYTGTWAGVQSLHDDPIIWGAGGIMQRTDNALGLRIEKLNEDKRTSLEPTSVEGSHIVPVHP